MALTVGTDSYVSVEEADTYFAWRFFVNTSEWDNASTEQKENALVEATRRMDQLELRGRKKDPGQVLQFPRCYSTVVEDEPKVVCDAGVLPNVKRACCEEALTILSDEEAESGPGVPQVLASREAVTLLKPYVSKVRP